MKYVMLFLLILFSIYPVSFARHSWRQKKRTAAVGVMLLVLGSDVFLGYILLLHYADIVK